MEIETLPENYLHKIFFLKRFSLKGFVRRIRVTEEDTKFKNKEGGWEGTETKCFNRPRSNS